MAGTRVLANVPGSARWLHSSCIAGRMVHIDIHIARLGALPLAEPLCLGEVDRERLARITHERTRRAFLGGRHLLQWLLPGRLPDLKQRAGGKPVFEDPSLPAVSLSHSHDRVVCALLHDAPGPFDIGVDIERAVDRPALFDRFESLFPREAALLGKADDPDRHFDALRLWTLKEAVAKATGSGLSGFGRIQLLPSVEEAGAHARLYRYAHWLLGEWHLALAWQGSARVGIRIHVVAPASGRSRCLGEGLAETFSGIAHCASG